MAYKKKLELATDKTVSVGGKNETTGVNNPTEIEGYYLGYLSRNGDYGVTSIHVFQTPEGNIGVWGKTKSNQLLTPDLRGQMVKLVFTGMKAPTKKGRRPSYNYELFVDKENTIDVSDIVLSAPEETNVSDDDYPSDNDSETSSYGTTVSLSPGAKAGNGHGGKVVLPTSSSVNQVQEMLNRSRIGARTS